jgi:hypothetical protein
MGDESFWHDVGDQVWPAVSANGLCFFVGALAEQGFRFLKVVLDSLKHLTSLFLAAGSWKESLQGLE